MSNRGAYSTKERMPSDIKLLPSLPAWKAVPDCFTHELFAMYCPPGSIKDYGLIPAHPRCTRMYGVTHSTVFQIVRDLRNLSKVEIVNT